MSLQWFDCPIYGGIFDLEHKQRTLLELEDLAAEPDFWSNTQQAQKASQRISSLRAEIQYYQDVESELEDLKVLLELAIEENDANLSQEIVDGLDQLAQKLDKMELSVLLDGKHDTSNAIINIRPGAGGTESQDWAAMLMRMYLRWCEEKNYDTGQSQDTHKNKTKQNAQNKPKLEQHRS